MFTLKHVVVIFILQYRVSSFSLDYYNDQDYPKSGISRDVSTDLEDYEYDYWWNHITRYPDGSSEFPEFSSGETPYIDNTYNPENSLTTTPDDDNNKIPNDDKNERSEKPFINFCPDDHSMISDNDIKKLIEENAEILKIQQHFVNSSYFDVEELIKKFKGELDSFLQTIIDRPDHLRHILQDMTGLRQKLEPDVEKIVSQLELFHTIESNMNEVVEDSDKKLRQLEKFKNLCESCEEIDVRNRFRQYDNNNPSLDLQSTGTYCIRLADLNKIIHEKLSEQLSQSQHNDSFNVQLEVSEKSSYIDQKLTEFETNFKKSAVKLFGMTMYDILSLQDDYHHFVEYLNQVNVSFETYDIRKNIAEISFRVIELERGLDKYKQYCVNCVVINQRINNNGFGLLDVGTMNNVQEPEIPDKPADIEAVVIDLIKFKVGEIRKSIISNLTATFDDLERQINDSKVFDEYVMELRSKQDVIENEVKSEQLAFLKLTSLIPKASVNKMLEMSMKSNQTIQDLESAKQFINQFFSNKYWLTD